MADGYEVEGTKQYVLELLMHGFAYASCYVLLKSRTILQHVDDDAMVADVGTHPSKYGKVLKFDKDLFLDRSDGSIFIELG